MTLWNDQQNRFGVLCGSYFLRQWSPPMRQRAFLCETVTRDCLRLGRICCFSRIYVMPSRTLDADLLCAVNGRMTRSASMYPGRIRAHGEDVFVRTPFGVFVPGTPDMVRLKDASGEGNSAADPLPADFNAERPNSGGPSVTESAVGDAR